MPLLEISARDALARAKADPYRGAWPDHTFPAARHSGVVEVFCSPTFEIHRDDRIFTIGSCFARNIEARLGEIGLRTVFDEATAQGLVDLGETRSFINKYNVSSIRHELEWTCGEVDVDEQHVLLPTGESTVLDAFFNPRRKTGVAIADARRRRAFLTERFAQLAQCRIVVMTLGLAEVWRDRRSGLRLNVAPVGPIKRDPDRFVLEVLSYDDILTDLEAIHALLSRRCPADFKILITVSPVPLLATLRGQDVMMANTYSKAVQRAAVEAFVLRHDNVDYFPSYETVTLTDRRLAFENDNRHVQPAVVARIVDRFVAAYIPELAFDQTTRPVAASDVAVEKAEDLLRSAKLHARQGLEAEAADLYRRLIELHGDQLQLIPTSHLRLKYANALLKSGAVAEGLQQIELAARAHDAGAGIPVKAIERFLAYKDFAGAARLLEAFSDSLQPELRDAFSQALAQALQPS